MHCLPVSPAFGVGSYYHAADRGASGLHPDVLPQRKFQRDVVGRTGFGDRGADRCRYRDGRERVQASGGTQRPGCRRTYRQTQLPGTQVYFGASGKAGWPCVVLFTDYHSGVVPSRVLVGGPGRPNVPSLGLDQDAGVGVFLAASITLVPVLMPLFIRGRLRPESQNPAARLTQAVYLPVLRWCLRHWELLIAIN